MQQDKHFVIFHGREDRDIFINKLNYSKTIYHIDGIGGEAEPGDIITGKQQVIDWIMASYIVDNYDNLHEYTIFTQADPTDHVIEPLLAIESTLTDKYGSFCYARSFYEQYTLNWDRLHASVLSAQRLGIAFHNSLNTRKYVYLCCPGTIFYVHRDRIRQRPKSFYENIIKCDNDSDFFDYVINYDHPQWLYDTINQIHPEMRGLSNKEKIKLLTIDRPKSGTLNSAGVKDDYFGVSTEPLWNLIFQSPELIEHLETAQAAVGNELYFNTKLDKYDADFKFYPFPYHPSIQKSMMNFRLLENNWFDWDCPNYLKWREALIHQTVLEGESRGFDGRELVKYYENFGYKHISL